MPPALLEVDRLVVEFTTDTGVVQAVNDISFELQPGQTLGIVGESGSGKSVANLAVMGLVPQPPGRIVSGEISFRGRNLRNLSRQDWSAIRGKQISMIFQDPMTALNPYMTIADQMREVTQRHLGHRRRVAIDHAVEMLERVGIPAARERVFDYPHQFSGGMRQRVMIAMALSCKPEILIADEPTTALDVTIQAQILDLMKELQRDEGTAIIFITHDLGVVANICQEVMVMYAGRIVEHAQVGPLFQQPLHPYTLGLLQSGPRWDQRISGELNAIDGQPPDLSRLPAGCAFAARCPYIQDRCRNEPPPLLFQETAPAGRRGQACFHDLASSSSSARKELDQ